MTTPTPTQRVEQSAFDAYHDIAALRILHTDVICNILAKHFQPLATELEAAQADNAKLLELANNLSGWLTDLADACDGNFEHLIKASLTSVDNFTTYKQSKGIK